MLTVYGITETPDLCGWLPLLEWFDQHGIDGRDVYRCSIDVPGMLADVDEFSRNPAGRLRTDPVTRRPLCTRRTVAIRSLPPEPDGE